MAAIRAEILRAVRRRVGLLGLQRPTLLGVVAGVIVRVSISTLVTIECHCDVAVCARPVQLAREGLLETNVEQYWPATLGTLLILPVVVMTVAVLVLVLVTVIVMVLVMSSRYCCCCCWPSHLVESHKIFELKLEHARSIDLSDVKELT